MGMSAIEKLRKPRKIEVVFPLPAAVAHWGPPGASMLIATPQEVDALVRQIRKGKLATTNTLREALAKRHGTTITCPVTTGIFLNIAARAAAEMETMGARRVTPWWRVLKSDGTLNEKYPGGIAEQKKRLEAEGFTIIRKGKNKLVVEGFGEKLTAL